MKKKQTIEGFWDLKPRIKKVDFSMRGKISIYFQDGRVLIAPISSFPNIKTLTVSQRKKWYLFGNGFSFEDCNEVFHIEQFLGNFQTYRHESK